MSTHRTWDESQSPQWKYLLQKESALKRGGRKTAARLRRNETEEEYTEKKKKKEKEEGKVERWKNIDKMLKDKTQIQNDTT